MSEEEKRPRPPSHVGPKLSTPLRAMYGPRLTRRHGVALRDHHDLILGPAATRGSALSTTKYFGEDEMDRKYKALNPLSHSELIDYLKANTFRQVDGIDQATILQVSLHGLRRARIWPSPDEVIEVKCRKKYEGIKKYKVLAIQPPQSLKFSYAYVAVLPMYED